MKPLFGVVVAVTVVEAWIVVVAGTTTGVVVAGTTGVTCGFGGIGVGVVGVELAYAEQYPF